MEHEFIKLNTEETKEREEPNNIMEEMMKQKELDAALGFETLNVDKENIADN